MEQQWFGDRLTGTVRLPGSLQEQGYGLEPSVDMPWTGSVFDRSWFTEPEYEPYRRPGNVKIPFALQAERLYEGVAWYQRDIEVPADWEGERILLHLERPHWETTVWVDERRVGSHRSLSVPHEYDLSSSLVPGTRRITIRVDNRMIVNVGRNSHSVTDHTQSNWNGIVGRIELQAEPATGVERVEVVPDAADGSVRILAHLRRAAADVGEKALRWTVHSGSQPLSGEESVTADEATLLKEFTIDLGPDPVPWDEFAPHLYRVEIQFGRHRLEVSFGLRDLGTAGTRCTINGRPLFFRGTLECCIFPLTGYPATDVESWKRIIRICKAHGLNHIRFHSWCPPEAAFVAADELGFYYQVECASWANQGATIGDGTPLDAWLYEETEHIIRAYGNHPSFVLMAYGNEPAGDKQDRWLGDWINHTRERDGRRLYTSGAGWPMIPECDFYSHADPRIQRWGEGLKSIINAHPPQSRFDFGEFVQEHSDRPVVSHEIGQWCAFPNFTEMEKYTGVLKPGNFEIFQELLEKNGMGDQARDFLMASGKLQALCYKADIEAALRTPGLGGYQLLDLHDFPGQGTALVGVLDAFWDSKGYIDAKTFRRFCGPTVVLARMDRFTWTQNETLQGDIEIAHFGKAPIRAQPTWRLLDEDGAIVRAGRLPEVDIQLGNGQSLGDFSIPLADITAPARYRLSVRLEGTEIENEWPVWVYPTRVETEPHESVLWTREWDEAARVRLRAGGTVVLAPDPHRFQTESEIGFSSIFWNTLWTQGQPPHTLGILCNPDHPVFDAFPTSFHSDWQWWELIHGSAAMVLDDLPRPLRPLVQPIDTWFSSRRLGLLLEARVEQGVLLICSMDLETDLERRVVARQFRHSLVSYAANGPLEPSTTLNVDDVDRLFRAE